ncbi:MAG: RNA polymerase sigma factor [Proteobacteria bacterium]|nr:RNA polymerase sigma factor [Pseudomonadota bacterium]
MNTAEHLLLESLRRERDESSFRALYRRHTPMLFAMAIRLTGKRSEAEELTQETWVRAVERIDRFDGRALLSTWLTGILLNCLREARRRYARDHAAIDDAESASAKIIPVFPGPHTLVDAAEVERALSQLAAGYREVVLLHDVYGHTHLEIADMLGIQEGTSKSQLMRGRAQLRVLINAPHSAQPEHNERGAT